MVTCSERDHRYSTLIRPPRFATKKTDETRYATIPAASRQFLRIDTALNCSRPAPLQECGSEAAEESGVNTNSIELTGVFLSCASPKRRDSADDERDPRSFDASAPHEKQLRKRIVTHTNVSAITG